MFFFFNDTATTEIYTLSLHDALPIFHVVAGRHRRVSGDHEHVVVGEVVGRLAAVVEETHRPRSEEHTSELQSRQYLVCRLLLEKKNNSTPVTTLSLLSYFSYITILLC